MYIVIYLLSLCNFYDNLVNICVFVLRKARKTLKYSFIYVFNADSFVVIRKVRRFAA